MSFSKRPFDGDLACSLKPVGPATDLTRWRLHSVKGRQTWLYEDGEGVKREQSFIERHSLGLDTVSLMLGIMCVHVL